jgi:hypothetical protein
VITPLVFLGDARQFAGNLSFNTVTLCRALIIDLFNEQAGKLIESVFNAVPLPDDGESPAAKRERYREQLLRDVAQTFVPRIEVDLEGNISIVGETDFGTRANDALLVFKRNAGVVINELMRGYLDQVTAEVRQGIEEAINAIPAEMLPGDFERENLGERLLVGTTDALAPTIVFDDEMNLQVDFDAEAARRAFVNRLSINAADVFDELVSGYVDETAEGVVTLIKSFADPLPEGFSEPELRGRIREGVAEAMVKRDAGARRPAEFRPASRADGAGAQRGDDVARGGRCGTGGEGRRGRDRDRERTGAASRRGDGADARGGDRRGCRRRLPQRRHA